MSKPVVEVQIRGLAGTSGVCVAFLGNEEKVFVIYVEQSVGRRSRCSSKAGKRSDRSLPNTEKSRPLETSTRENGRIGRSDQGACRIAVLRTESFVKERHIPAFGRQRNL